MEYDLSRMDPLYWILQKDSQVQVLQQAAINLVARRLPRSKKRAQEILTTVNDLERLQELIPEFSVLSQEEVDEVLDQLCKQQLQEEAHL